MFRRCKRCGQRRPWGTAEVHEFAVELIERAESLRTCLRWGHGVMGSWGHGVMGSWGRLGLPGLAGKGGCEPADHAGDHGPLDHRLRGGREPFVVVIQPAVAYQPREGALDHLPAGMFLRTSAGV
jgi:hypothetical protein